MQSHFKIQYKTIINAPIEKVWDALTNPEIVKQYFFGTEMITTWKVGDDIICKGVWEGQPYFDKGKVLEYVHNEKLSHTYLSSWSGMEDKPENYLFVGYEVIPTENGTALIISQTNYDEERANHSASNWATLIDGMKKIIE